MLVCGTQTIRIGAIGGIGPVLRPSIGPMTPMVPMPPQHPQSLLSASIRRSKLADGEANATFWKLRR
jgi:hypothetical protein